MRLLVLPALVLLVLVVVWLVLRAQGSRALPGHDENRRGSSRADLEPPADIAAVRELAWDHRELDPELAGALIEQIRRSDAESDGREVRDDLMELAWQHRESSPELSVIVIDTLRRGGEEPPRPA